VQGAPRRESPDQREGITLANGAQLNLFGPVPGRRERRCERRIRDPAAVEDDQIV
jgi:hypothetical protein